MIFLKIIQMPRENIPSNNELSWLYIITKNQTIDYLKKQHNYIDIDTIYDAPDTDDQINEIIDKDTYNNIINCLENKEKEIVSLKVLTDFTFKEIGLILNMPTATVQWKYYKSVHTLKLLLSNLAMFIIVTYLYVRSTITLDKTLDNTDIIENTDSTKQNNNKTIDSISQSAINGFKAESITSSIQSMGFSDITQTSLFSVSAIFLILTIIFGIIFAKHQQKRHHKSSK